jgi:hypothetical protein
MRCANWQFNRWSGAEPWVCAREHPASEGAEECAKRDFRSKTLGTPSLIPAFNDDGQEPGHALAILSSAALSERVAY